MKQAARPTILFAISVTALLYGAPAASAQLLPGVTDRVVDTAGRIEETIDRRIASQIEELNVIEDIDDLDALPDLLKDDLLGPVQSSDLVGNTLSTSRLLSNGLVSAIKDLSASAAPHRPIDLSDVDGRLVMRNEWVLLVPASATERVRSLDFTALEETALPAANSMLFVLRFEGSDTEIRNLERELIALGADVLDRNHVYASADGPNATDDHRQLRQMQQQTQRIGVGRKLGMVDTDVDETHSGLRGLSLREQDFVSHGTLRPMAHGTAVASVLARQSSNVGAELLAASAFFVSDDGTTGATTSSLLSSFDWLITEGVEVINVSLTGPPNAAMEAYIARMQAKGVVFVAAVGNEGPASGPLYPAAYDGVIGVTAVDGNGKVYRWANRGPFVDIAAEGVNVRVAKPVNDETLQSGTSFAAPLVSAYLAGWTDADVVQETPEAALIRAAGWTPETGRDDSLGLGVLRPPQK